MAEAFTITLSHDQALVLSHWLDEVMGTPEFDEIVNRDPAVWSPLHRIAGNLDKALPEIVAPDYTHRLAAAREHLRATLGDEPTADHDRVTANPVRRWTKCTKQAALAAPPHYRRSMPTATILGGTGTIGRAVARRLLASGWDVTAVGRTPSRMPGDVAAAGGRFVAADRDEPGELATAVGVDAKGNHVNSDTTPGFGVPVTESQPTMAPREDLPYQKPRRLRREQSGSGTGPPRQRPPVLLDDQAPEGLGRHPWDRIPPIRLDMTTATHLGYRPAGDYAATVTTELDWLMSNSRFEFAERRLYPIDYAAEDTYLGTR